MMWEGIKTPRPFAPDRFHMSIGRANAYTPPEEHNSRYLRLVRREAEGVLSWTVSSDASNAPPCLFMHCAQVMPPGKCKNSAMLRAHDTTNKNNHSLCMVFEFRTVFASFLYFDSLCMFPAWQHLSLTHTAFRLEYINHCKPRFPGIARQL